MAFQKGDLAVFEDLLFLYEKRIFSYIFSITKNREDAEDITQDVFIKIFKKRRSLDMRKNIKSFIFAVATNSAYDFLRKKKSRRELFIIDDPESGFETIEEPVSYYLVEIGGVSDEDLKLAMGEIKPIYRSALVLFYQEGLAYEEIAEALSLPLNTIKTYIYRGKKALKVKLENKKYA